MFRPDQPFREEARYTSEDGEFYNVPVKVLEQDEDADGEDIFSIRLPLTGESRIAYADELTPRPDAPETISEAIDHLLTWSHPLCHAFVIEALGRYAGEVLADPEETRRAMEGSMIHADAWLASAEAVAATVDRLTAR